MSTVKVVGREDRRGRVEGSSERGHTDDNTKRSELPERVSDGGSTESTYWVMLVWKCT